MQTVAAIRYVTSGAYSAKIAEYDQLPVAPEFESYKSKLKDMADKTQMAVNQINEAKNAELHDLVARRLYEMTAYTIMGYLIVQDASKAPELFGTSARVFVRYAEAEVEKHMTFIRKFQDENLEDYRVK